MQSMMLVVAMALLTSTALAVEGDSAIGNETPTASQAQDKVAAETVDEAKSEEEFKVPVGYQAKKRGKKMVYCKKSMESGTRFSQERCFSEEQLRAMEAEQEQDQAAFDQGRKVCATAESCAGN